MTAYDRDRVTLSKLVLEELAAMPLVLRVLVFGDRKHPGMPWKKQSAHEHTAHALEHGKAWLGGTKIDPESGESNLAHFVVRGLFALATEMRGK